MEEKNKKKWLKSKSQSFALQEFRLFNILRPEGQEALKRDSEANPQIMFPC